TTPTVAEALKSLRAITVGDIRTMSDSDLRLLTDLLKQWIDITAIEEKRREEKADHKGSRSPPAKALSKEQRLAPLACLRIPRACRYGQDDSRREWRRYSRCPRIYLMRN